MGFRGESININSLTGGDPLEGIEELHGKIELFLKEFLKIRKICGSACEHDAGRGRSSVLTTEESVSALNFRCQAGQAVANNRSKCGGRLVELRGMPSSESDHSVGKLGIFRFGKGHVILLCNGRGKNGSSNRNAAGEELGAFRVNQVGGLGSDIDQQSAFLQIRVIIAQRIVERSRCGVHQTRSQTGFGNDGVQVIERLGLNGHQNDFGVDSARFQLFPVPNNLIDGEGNVLLRFEFHQLVHSFVLERRELDEANEDRLSSKGVCRLLAAELQALGEFFDCQLDLRNASRLGRRIGEDTSCPVGFQNQVILGGGENTHGNPLRANVQCDDRLCVSHNISFSVCGKLILGPGCPGMGGIWVSFPGCAGQN